MTLLVGDYLQRITPDFRKFNPIWFISIMGTGISSSILYNFPYEAYWLRVISMIMFGVCSFTLLTSSILFFMSLKLDESNRDGVLYELNMNVFLGCYAMGFTSWVNMIHFITGGDCPLIVYVLWWISNIMSLFTAWFILFQILRKSKVEFEKLLSTILLPIVALVVTSTCGQIIYPSLPHKLQLSTIIISFLLWANAIGLTFIFITIYLHRLLIHKFPPKASIFTTFIIIGPFGQGAFSIQLFGVNLHEYIINSASTDNQNTAQIEALIFKTCGLLTGLFLQSLGIFFTFLAIASVVSYGLHNFHYGWWAMTFPVGTMSLASNETFKITGWEVFRVMSAIYGVASISLTVVCLICSIWLMLKSEDVSKKGTKSYNIEGSSSHSVFSDQQTISV